MKYVLIVLVLSLSTSVFAGTAKYKLTIFDLSSMNKDDSREVPAGISDKIQVSLNDYTCVVDPHSMQDGAKIDLYSLSLTNGKNTASTQGITSPKIITSLSLDSVQCWLTGQ